MTDLSENGSLHEPRDGAAESSLGPQSRDVHLLLEPLDAAARGDPVSSTHIQQDRYESLTMLPVFVVFNFCWSPKSLLKNFIFRKKA